MNTLQAGLGSEEGQAAVNDILNFATGGVTIFFAEIDRRLARPWLRWVRRSGLRRRARSARLRGSAEGDRNQPHA
jgi:hypothetical protein